MLNAYLSSPGRYFNEVADLYDEVRPGYAEEVISTIIDWGGRTLEGKILEIGCGTGQITVPFAERGYTILALEPGDKLAAIAGRKCRAYPRVDIVQTTFEKWPIEPQAFSLILSAQAFHWIEPDFGLNKAADALTREGAIALVWHRDVSQNTDFWRMTQPIYDRYFPPPDESREVNVSTDQVRIYTEAIQRCKRFRDVRVFRHTWETLFGGREYLKLLNTFSPQLSLPELQRAQFFQEMAYVINRFDDMVPRQYETVLVFATKNE